LASPDCFKCLFNSKTCGRATALFNHQKSIEM